MCKGVIVADKVTRCVWEERAMRFFYLILPIVAALGYGVADAREFVLSDSGPGSREKNWSISSSDLGIATESPFAVSKRILHGGKQEGVELIEIDNGTMTITVIPTRGMGIFQVHSGDVTLGWNSPVEEIVNPAFIELESRGGLGWLDGFNEMLVRCGYEWTGHPGMDEGRLLSLHGRAGNTPASKVVVVIDDEPPHRIRVRGQVNEKVFKFVNYETWTELSTEPGSQSFEINDTLTNRADYEHEYQVIYHGNFGPPLLEAGSEFVAPVKTVAPFNDDAAKDIETWTTYLGPTKDYGEQVYNVIPYADADGWTTVMLHNKDGNRGVKLEYDTRTLPYFTLWKNTDTEKEGYVTGLEPGTGYAYTRAIERKGGRVPKLPPGESRLFRLTYTILSTEEAVSEAAREISDLQGQQTTQVDTQPTAKEAE
jgi:hypothetical protein